MRYWPVLILLLVLSNSCVVLVPEGVVATGNFWQVTHDDLRRAIALAQENDAQFRSGSIGEVQVPNRSELYVYVGRAGVRGSGRYAVIRRINGQWRYISSEDIIITG